jgi:hypothetical protein
MSGPKGDVPWPVWAIVMILVALIGAYASMDGSDKNADREPFPLPGGAEGQAGSADSEANRREPFQLPGGAKGVDCWHICGSANAVCLGATRPDGQSVTCEFKGVKSPKSLTGFEFRDKTCTCQRK